MDRREFIRRGGALSAAGLAANLDLLSLTAQAAVADYKALVCVFLFGGVDGNNVLVPLDTAGYGDYARVRGASSGIQLTQAQLLPIAPRNVGTTWNTVSPACLNNGTILAGSPALVVTNPTPLSTMITMRPR